ncbi:LOW QUALITY PROTEIN: maestro heat-like repeat-containing protein family member 2A [Sarcophilus harrisii]
MTILRSHYCYSCHHCRHPHRRRRRTLATTLSPPRLLLTGHPTPSGDAEKHSLSRLQESAVGASAERTGGIAGNGRRPDPGRWRPPSLPRAEEGPGAVLYEDQLREQGCRARRGEGSGERAGGGAVARRFQSGAGPSQGPRPRSSGHKLPVQARFWERLAHEELRPSLDRAGFPSLGLCHRVRIRAAPGVPGGPRILTFPSGSGASGPLRTTMTLSAGVLGSCIVGPFGSRMQSVISKEVRWEELLILLQSTCESLGATNLAHDKAAVTWLNTILRLRGHELEDKVPEILSTILAHLPSVLHPDVRRPLVEAVLLLAHSYQETVITSLLRQPLPLDSNITELWEALAEDATFARKILQALMARIQVKKAPRSSPTSKKDIWRLAAVDPITAVCALHKITMAMDSREKLQDIFPELSCTVLQELSSSSGPWQAALPPDTWGVIQTGNLQNKITPRRLTIKTLQGVLSRAGSEEMMDSLVSQGVWTLLEDPRTHIDGVCLLARTMILHVSPYSQRFAQLLLSGLDSEFLSWRLSSTAFFIELMCDPILYKKKMLKSTVLKLAKASHVHSTLRLLSIRALGNLAIGAPSKVRHYRKLLLKKLLCSLCDPISTQVISETMVALSKVLGLMGEEDLGSSFEVISMQCRAFFDDENEMLRLHAIILFGKLAVWAGKKKDFFAMEVRKSWIPLILHLQDPCPEVAKACEVTICLCIPFWGWRKLQVSLEKFVNQGTDLSLFQMEMCSYLARKDPDLLDTFCAEAISYYDSEWARIKAAACTFTGYVLEQGVSLNLGEMDMERLGQCLEVLQMDPELIVQDAAKETLTLLRRREQQESGNMSVALARRPAPSET